MTMRSSASRGSTPALIVALVLAVSALSAQTPAPATTASRPGPTSRRSRRSGSRDAKPDRPVNNRPVTTSRRNSRGWVHARCPDAPDMFMSFDFTAGSRDGGSQTHGRDTEVCRAQRRGRALLLRRWHGLGARRVRRLRHRRPGVSELRIRQLCDARREGQGGRRLQIFPEDADKETKSILARYSDLRYKALAARQRGAKALIVVTGPRSPNAGQTVPITFDTALAGSGIPAASISGKGAAALFGSRSLEVGAKGVR